MSVSSSPQQLVPSFRLASKLGDSSKQGSRNYRGLDQELQEGVHAWEGRAVFFTTTLTKPSNIGSATSPISVSPSPPDLRRPRAKPHYTSPLPRTAFTPPRPVNPSLVSTRPEPPKSIHPFFNRSKSVPPPPPPSSQRPRLVAHYSSTSESSKTGTQSQGTSATWDSLPDRWMMRDAEIELLAEEVGRLGVRDTTPTRWREEVEEVEEVFPTRKPLANAQILPSRRPALPVPRSKAPKHPSQPSNLPLFDHRTFTPQNRPRAVYTTTAAEADDLLSCLRGPVLGFDLEWPVTGIYKTAGPGGRMVEKKVGMKWTGTGWGFEQARTALVQLGDEKLIVLVHMRDMTGKGRVSLGSAQAERRRITSEGHRHPWRFGNLQDRSASSRPVPYVPKLAQADDMGRTGDGLKLLRDFPTSFPKGINSLLELSQMARRVDPIGTGPGAQLISLANLGRGYLGKEIDKDDGVRKGNWMDRLGSMQIDYAANDVYASLQIYLALARRAEGDVNLRDFCSDLGDPAAYATGPSDLIATPEGVAAGGVGGPKPSELRALQKFKGGMTTDAIALEGEIKVTTIHGYICKALQVLPVDTLAEADKIRFLSEIPTGSYVLKLHRHMVKRLRRDVGETVSESDDERVEA